MRLCNPCVPSCLSRQPLPRVISGAASAQDTPSDNGTSFRGVRVEGNVGGDRFQSQGVHNDKLGYGGTVGFDGTIGGRFVIGAEGSYWRANDWTENCTAASNGSTCQKSFEEWGAAVRAGALVTPNTLVFAKGGYVNNEQRKRFTMPQARVPSTTISGRMVTRSVAASSRQSLRPRPRVA